MEIVLIPLNWAPYTITQVLYAARAWASKRKSDWPATDCCTAWLLGEAKRQSTGTAPPPLRSPPVRRHHPPLPPPAPPARPADSRRLFHRLPPPSAPPLSARAEVFRRASAPLPRVTANVTSRARTGPRAAHREHRSRPQPGPASPAAAPRNAYRSREEYWIGIYGCREDGCLMWTVSPYWHGFDRDGDRAQP